MTGRIGRYSQENYFGKETIQIIHPKPYIFLNVELEAIKMLISLYLLGLFLGIYCKEIILKGKIM